MSTAHPEPGQSETDLPPKLPSPQARRGWRWWGRRLLLTLAWAWFIVLVLWFALRFFDLQGHVPLLQALLPAAFVTLPGLLVLALLLRQRSIMAASAALALVAATMTVPWFIPRTVAGGHDDVVVMAANLLTGEANATDLQHAVTRHGVDILVLTEITPQAMSAAEASGVTRALPYRAGEAGTRASGTIVLSRWPLNEVTAPQGSFTQVAVSVRTPVGAWTVLGAHPMTPLYPAWRTDLRAIERWRQSQPTDRPLVIAGDLNSSNSHPALRAVAATMTDAHRAAGQGWVRSWPLQRRTPAFVQIDHILVRDLNVVDAGTATLRGTDHRAVWARIQLSRRVQEGPPDESGGPSVHTMQSTTKAGVRLGAVQRIGDRDGQRSWQQRHDAVTSVGRSRSRRGSTQSATGRRSPPGRQACPRLRQRRRRRRSVRGSARS
ncbi:endonuclease/exonuclease/phosphatase family protein [Dermacoccaceae bacterium W4C1]